MTTKHQRYSRSPKGRARDARYRAKNWLRVEERRMAWNEARRQRRINELHTEK